MRALRLVAAITALALAAVLLRSGFLLALAVALPIGSLMLALWNRWVRSDAQALWSAAAFFALVGGGFLAAGVYVVASRSATSGFTEVVLVAAVSVFGLYMLYLGGGIAYFAVTRKRPPGSARLASVSQALLKQR